MLRKTMSIETKLSEAEKAMEKFSFYIEVTAIAMNKFTEAYNNLPQEVKQQIKKPEISSEGKIRQRNQSCRPRRIWVGWA